jgi:dCMP deaminase
MENAYKRPSWDEYFMSIADLVGSRGTCDRGRLGCVIVKDKRVIATGYVGSPLGIAHCDEIGHEMHTVTHEDGSQSRHCIRTTHAEQNAICQAARTGIPLEGATIYQKMTPCYVCAKMIINSGIKRVVCQKNYHGSGRAAELFAETGVQYKVLSNELEVYADMKPNEEPAVVTNIDPIAVATGDAQESNLASVPSLNSNISSAEIPL